MGTSYELAQWLQNELSRLGWTQAELARRSKITPAQISRILSGARAPGIETLNAIAIALNRHPETIFRAAGVLPPQPEKPPEMEEWMVLFEQISPDDRDELLQLARLKVLRQRKAKQRG